MHFGDVGPIQKWTSHDILSKRWQNNNSIIQSLVQMRGHKVAIVERNELVGRWAVIQTCDSIVLGANYTSKPFFLPLKTTEFEVNMVCREQEWNISRHEVQVTYQFVIHAHASAIKNSLHMQLILVVEWNYVFKDTETVVALQWPMVSCTTENAA